MRIKLLLSLLGFILATNLSAQTSLSGKVTDAKSGEPVVFSNVKLFQKGVYKTGAQTDHDGNYSFSPLDAGVYDIELSHVGYQSTMITNIGVEVWGAPNANFKIEAGVDLEEIVVMDYKMPLFDQDRCFVFSPSVSQGELISSGKIIQFFPNIDGSISGIGTENKKGDSPSFNEVCAKKGSQFFSCCSISDDGDGVTIKGSRANATVYFLEGIHVVGADSLENSSVGKIEKSELKLWEYFPNPVKEFIQIDTENREGVIQVFNLHGIQLVEKSISNDITEVDLSNLVSGTYLLVYSGQGQVEKIGLVQVIH